MVKKAFHGTSSKFEKFDDSRMSGVNYGKAFYFTESRKEAMSFITSDDKGYLIEASLAITNPFDVHSKVHAKALADCLGLDWTNVSSNYNHMLEGSGLDESDRENQYHKVINELFEIGAGTSFQQLKHEIHETLLALGFDGMWDSKKQWWAVFFSNQISILRNETLLL